MESSPKKPRRTIREWLRTNRLTNLLRGIRALGNEIARIKVKWLVSGIIIFALSIGLTQYQFSQVGHRERDRIDRDSRSRDYLLTLQQWTSDKIVFDACVVNVDQSHGNRAWKTWLLDKIDELPGETAQDFVAEGRAKLDELVPELNMDGCTDPGDPPVKPADFNPEVSDPTTTEVR